MKNDVTFDFSFQGVIEQVTKKDQELKRNLEDQENVIATQKNQLEAALLEVKSLQEKAEEREDVLVREIQALSEKFKKEEAN